MARPTTPEDLEKNLTNKLLNESNLENKCPNLKVDKIGPYCNRDLKEGEPPSKQRREICDNASLQLWCLDKDRYNICIWYKGEPF